MLEDSTSQLIERKEEIPEIPNYMKEKMISFYTATVFSTIIVFFAIISLIINIKRKSNKRIVLSIILPIIAIIISKFLEIVVLKNGRVASSIIFIIVTLIVMLSILISLFTMILIKKKK